MRTEKEMRRNVTPAVSVSHLQVAMRCSVSSDHVKNVIIWGNHSSTQYPDVHHAKVNVHGSELAAYDAVKDDAWLHGEFISVSVLRFSPGFQFETELFQTSSCSCASPRRCSSAAQLSSRPGSCPAPCLLPKPSATTWGTSGSAPRRWARTTRLVPALNRSISAC